MRNLFPQKRLGERFVRTICFSQEMCKIDRFFSKFHLRIKQFHHYTFPFLLTEYELNINLENNLIRTNLVIQKPQKRKAAQLQVKSLPFLNNKWVLSKVIIGIDQIRSVTLDVPTSPLPSLRLVQITEDLVQEKG